MANVARTGQHARSRAAARLPREHRCVRDVRGAGLIWGLELDRPAAPVVEAALERGLLINRTADTVIRLLPPYIITRAGRRSDGGAAVGGNRRRDAGGTVMTTWSKRVQLRGSSSRVTSARDVSHRAPRRTRRRSTVSSPTTSRPGHLLPRDRRRRGARRAASWWPKSDGVDRRLRRAGAAVRRRSPKSARSSSINMHRGRRHRCAAGRHASRPPARAGLRDAVRVHARAVASSSGSDSRSCRTSGCPRRSRTTARAARCSAAAASTP